MPTEALRGPLSAARSLAFLGIAFVAPNAFAQQPGPCPDAGKSTFDVASVRPSERSSGNTSFRARSDTLEVGATALRMIEYAYKLHDYQVSGGPDWIHTSSWEATAKVDQPPADWQSLPSDTRNTISRQRMIGVLIQRFALRCHFETKELPVYNLVVAKSGPKLKPTAQDTEAKGSFGASNNDGRVRMEANGIPMDLFATNLSQSLDRTVIDKTGLTGIYDFVLNYTSDVGAGPPAAADSTESGPTIFTALEEQLGLRLEPAKGQVPVLVIDAIKRPSEN